MNRFDASFFIRQQDEISCGPACLATVAKLYGVDDVDYAFFRGLLKPDPAVGSCNFQMAEVSEKYLPFKSAGEDSYAGGVGVANIMEDEGHYVVFLNLEGDEIVYYDPYDHKIFTKALSSLNWISESGHLTRWSVNFTPVAQNSNALWQAIAL
ncbi:MAG: hypothetical protein GC185_06915 [Alphaproteobacteria bacterium]|nr:hypothetical protein [Alphaproteobacteria bacterium]